MVMPFGQNKNTLDTTIYLIGNVVNMDVTILFLSPDADHIFLFGCVGRTKCPSRSAWVCGQFVFVIPPT